MKTHPPNRQLTGRSQLAADLILGMIRSGSYAGSVSDLSSWGHSLADKIYEQSDQELAEFYKACEEEKALNARK